MTREEAIKNIKEHCYFANLIPPAQEALDMAIKALEQDPCGDCISREAVLKAIDAKVWEFCDYLISKGRNDEQKPVSHFADNLRECVGEDLPSVTAQPKMVERWIPVSERLPDTLKEVIIAFANEPDEYDIAYLRTTSNKTYIANGSKKEWVSFMGETTYAEYEVDAWMPIIPYQSEIPTVAEGSEKND